MDKDLLELTEFVADNPDDHNQRWRLAKKLYGAWEYRGALEHLEALKKVWPNKQNVIYYLATTQYRMGNYDDAITELEAILEIYPSDTSVRRLLARICEASGQRSRAAEVYKEIKHHSPSPSIEQAVDRLDNELSVKSTAIGRPLAEQGFDKTQITCRFCDSPNDFLNDRCWQCHASLDAEEQEKAGALREGGKVKAAGGVSKRIIVAAVTLLAAALGVIAFFTTR